MNITNFIVVQKAKKKMKKSQQIMKSYVKLRVTIINFTYNT